MNIVYRPMIPSDIDEMDAGFVAQGWGSRRNVLEKYLTEQAAGTRYVVFAQADGVAVGYATLIQMEDCGSFHGKNLPVVADFNVLETHQRHGIGSGILDRIEAKAAEASDTVYLGVGMHPGYGPAQRMYVGRGYIPDGSGIWYKDKPLAQNAPCVNDDDLVLYLSKRLK